MKMRNVSSKSILKGLTIGLPVAIMVTAISGYYVNLIDNYLKEKYQTERIVYVDKDSVLGEEDVVNLSESEDFQTAYTKWLYNEADRIVDTYDFTDKEIKPLIQIPTYEFPVAENIYEKSYQLSSSDTVTVRCNKLESEYTQVYDVHSCDVLLNSVEISTAWSWTDNIEISPHLTIFDDESLKSPLIVVGEQSGLSSRDNLLVYRVEDGKLVKILFNSGEESKASWFSDPYSKMYIENGKEYFVTYFHDPAMIEKSLTRVWEVSNKELELVETVLERELIK